MGLCDQSKNKIKTESSLWSRVASSASELQLNVILCDLHPIHPSKKKKEKTVAVLFQGRHGWNIYVQTTPNNLL